MAYFLGWRQGMPRINEHYTELSRSYLFVEIAKRVRTWEQEHPDTGIIKLGIGDVTRPLPPSAITALHEAADEMADPSRFRGYGPEQGYDFLRDAIVAHDYAPRSISISPDDVFVSDGSKCDTGNFQELFATDQTVAVPDPVYPVYVDTNIMAGRRDRIVYMKGTRDNGFVPPPPEEKVDLMYLCFPNNPTGATATREELTEYVNYALKNNALILFDAAYVEFIRDPELPRSIFEIPGAEGCAVEFRSFSKTAGFTGLRCAYTVIPGTVTATDSRGTEYSVRDLWSRRHSTKFNGASYPVQRAAAAVYSVEGSREIRELSDYYLGNAEIIREGVSALGLESVGGRNSPYIWVHADRPSWEFFDEILNRTGVVTTPGAGFGAGGEGFIRISAFNDRDKVETAMERITNNF
jgi:LL-diaminopimelate aminotransferase